MDVTRLFDLCIRWSVSVESNMFNVQRLTEIKSLKPEQKPNELSAVISNGKIEFKNVILKYG
jgi:ABC-type bacteriocin/lantibiotic exporter with double-glycine peptidase domain